MRSFFDTSVLIPVFAKDHIHHNASKAAFLQASGGERSCSAHTLAEFYSTFTRLPGKHRLDSNEVLLFIGDLLEQLSIVALTAEEYVAAIQEAAGAGVSGGTIYDALLVRCAIKARADVIYTWNVRHFQQFPEIISCVKAPSEFGC
ncbi:MAG: PIN domain-containing protein [Candidatus Acidiferrales bacterium]